MIHLQEERLLRIFATIIYSFAILPSFSQPVSYKIGMGLGGIGGHSMEFVDAAKTMRNFDGTSVDGDGHPLSDFQVVVFDMRPCCPWLGSVDDPIAFVPELFAGIYRVSFHGQANIGSVGDPVLIQNKKYDAINNLTMLDLVVQKGNWLVQLSFTGSKRTATSATNTGVTDLQLLRPGYHNRSGNVFRQEFLNAISHFPVIRFMDFVNTNNSNPDFPGMTEWADRISPDQAVFDGAPWEYVVELANITGKDVWINIPVAATDDYIHSLAQLFKSSLHEDAVIYFEFSNEIWNPGFAQHDYNVAAAKSEVQTEINGGTATLLNDDAGQCDPDDESLWGGRRYVKRMKEIGDIFFETFSPGDRISFETKIRPVFSWQIGGWIPYYSCILTWFESVYGGGSANDHFYGLAAAAYVNAEGASDNASASQIHAQMISNSNAGRGKRRDTPASWTTGEGKIGLREIADVFQLRMLQYETGPDNGGGSAMNVASRIAANRSPEMKGVLVHDLGTNWFNDNEIEGELAMYFVLCSSYTRYGSWGATEEVENMNTPKLTALYELSGILEDKEGPTFPTNTTVRMDGGDAIVTWEASSDNVAVTHYRISDKTGALATVLASEPLTVTLADFPSANAGSIKVTAFDLFNNPSGFNATITGIDHAWTNNALKVFPNPFTDNIVVEVDKAGQVSVTDMMGREVFRKVIIESVNSIELRLHHIPDGIYNITLFGDAGSVTKKIVKR